MTGPSSCLRTEKQAARPARHAAGGRGGGSRGRRTTPGGCKFKSSGHQVPREPGVANWPAGRLSLSGRRLINHLPPLAVAVQGLPLGDPLPPPPPCVGSGRVHASLHRHTHHTYMYAHILYKHTDMHTRVCSHMCIHRSTRVHAHIHMGTQAHTHTHVQQCSDACTEPRVCTYTHAHACSQCIHVGAHTPQHTLAQAAGVVSQGPRPLSPRLFLETQGRCTCQAALAGVCVVLSTRGLKTPPSCLQGSTLPAPSSQHPSCTPGSGRPAAVAQTDNLTWLPVIHDKGGRPGLLVCPVPSWLSSFPEWGEGPGASWPSSPVKPPPYSGPSPGG